MYYWRLNWTLVNADRVHIPQATQLPKVQASSTQNALDAQPTKTVASSLSDIYLLYINIYIYAPHLLKICFQMAALTPSMPEVTHD